MFGWEFPPFNSGGLGMACLGLTRALSARGLEITFVMPSAVDVKSSSMRFRFADEERVSMRVIESEITDPYGGGIDSTYFDKFGIKRRFYGNNLFEKVRAYTEAAARIAEEEEFDVIYAHDWLSFGAGMEAKRISGKKLITHVHATEFDRCGGSSSVNAFVYDIEKRGLESADTIVAVSDLTKRMVVEKYGIPADKVVVVHNGIDATTAPESDNGLKRLRMLKQEGYKVVLFLGRITIQKGPDYFVRAAKRVIDINPKVMFVLSGSGDMEKSMMQLAADLGIADHVLFTGFLRGPDIYDAYAAADLFVMPSVSEPFGIVPLEAMLQGTPVIISKQSGVAEVVRHALKIDFWDIDEMANKILSVVGHDVLHQTLSENGKAEVTKITWDLAAQKIDSLIHQRGLAAA